MFSVAPIDKSAVVGVPPNVTLLRPPLRPRLGCRQQIGNGIAKHLPALRQWPRGNLHLRRPAVGVRIAAFDLGNDLRVRLEPAHQDQGHK